MCKVIVIDSCHDCPHYCTPFDVPRCSMKPCSRIDSTDPYKNNCPLPHPHDVGLDWDTSDDI